MQTAFEAVSTAIPATSQKRGLGGCHSRRRCRSRADQGRAALCVS